MRNWIGRDIIEPVGRPLSTGCHDCDSVTGGRCWRHALTVYVPMPTYVVQPIVISPKVIRMLGPTAD